MANIGTPSSQNKTSGKVRKNDLLTSNPRRVRKWLRSSLVFIAILLLLQLLLAGSTLDIEGFQQNKGTRIPAKALILTAHPDDEVMFFAPAILNLVKSNVDVYALCLSNGNADGLGQTRKEELLASYARLGVRSDRVRLIDDDRLQDSMQIKWEPNLISKYVEQFSQHSGPFDLLLTFDKDGISQHTNHKACSNSVPLIYQSGAITENGRIYSLRSHGTAFKYLGLVGALVNHSSAKLRLASQDKVAFLSTPFEYLRSLQAMSLHKSQMVWFRYLYLFFSTYMHGCQFDIHIDQ